jgi:hypothetical protein
LKAFAFWFVFVAVFVYLAGLYMTMMPGNRPASTAAIALADDQVDVAESLERHVRALSTDVGPHTATDLTGMEQAAKYIRRELAKDWDNVQNISFDPSRAPNICVDRRGSTRPSQVILIGAHYDARPNSGGANDNASGCAVLLELARIMRQKGSDRSLRFVLFSGGAGDLAGAETSGAAHYLKHMHERGEAVFAMISLDSLGSFSTVAGSQRVPFPLSFAYPTSADFVACLGDFGARDLVSKTVETLRIGSFPAEGLVLPGFMHGEPSDHLVFQDAGIPAMVITDTGARRFPGVGTGMDTPERLDYARMARIVTGLTSVLINVSKREVHL